jgi:hypothetical protein
MECTWSCFDIDSTRLIHGREILAMEGKNALPMPIGPFVSKGGSIVEDT